MTRQELAIATRTAISGHRGLPPETPAVVAAEIRARVAQRADGDLVGVSCLADGPDTLFAQAVPRLGGSLVVVVPARKYREGLPAEHHSVYDELLTAASEVIALDREDSDSGG